MERALEQLVWDRAGARCEYCQLAVEQLTPPFQIDHIIALKHGGPTDAENLALSCYYCNSQKGPNLSGIDPLTGRVTRLFHPRKDRWIAHFQWRGPVLSGKSAIGRATIRVLWMNRPQLVLIREALIEGGFFPPVVKRRR